jgi:hypothetical protein
MNKELEANTNLSHYRIAKKLGAGGMGEAFPARDNEIAHPTRAISGGVTARRIHAISYQITPHLTTACTRPRTAQLSSARLASVLRFVAAGDAGR